MPHNNPPLLNSSQLQSHHHQTDSSSLVQGNLQLLYLALKLNEVSQESKKQQLARQNYRQNQGRFNKIAGAILRKFVTKSELDKFKERYRRELLSTQSTAEDDSQQQDIFAKDIEKILQQQDSLERGTEFSQLLEKPLTKINQDKILKGIERDLDRIRKSGSMIVEGLNCEGMDLRSLDLSMLIFKNCNFKGAKFSSMHNVEFHNDCNLEGSNWSGAELRDVEFGTFDTKLILKNLSKLWIQDNLC